MVCNRKVMIFLTFVVAVLVVGVAFGISKSTMVQTALGAGQHVQESMLELQKPEEPPIVEKVPAPLRELAQMNTSAYDGVPVAHSMSMFTPRTFEQGIRKVYLNRS